MSIEKLSDMRREYGLDLAATSGELQESELPAHWLALFNQWLTQAMAVSDSADEPNAMILATANKAGVPSARTVLLKKVDEKGFTFFTNYLSRKGRELAENPKASAVFCWFQIHRQVLISGEVQKLSSAESDEYFLSRPYGSQLAAAVSNQSTVLNSRQELLTAFEEMAQRYPEGSVPRPPHWGGYRIIPNTVEFWQGRPNRLHDRLQYRHSNNHWILERLSP